MNITLAAIAVVVVDDQAQRKARFERLQVNAQCAMPSRKSATAFSNCAIWQQGYAQREPIGVYRPEGFTLFPTMLGKIRREVTSALFDYDVPDFEHEEASPELSEMIEARLVDAFAGGDDGLDDGTLLAKDADGVDNDLVMTTQNTREGNPDSASNRAARRAKRRE